MGSDWNDIGQVVDHVRRRRGDATVQWLRTGQLNGMRSGTVGMGY
jgi:hypothetical protein